MLHMDGFDQFASETKLAAALVRSGYLSTGTVTPVTGRAAGSYALGMQKGNVTRAVAWTTPRLTIGFAHQFTDRGSCVKLKLGAQSITLWFNPDNGLPMMNDVQGNALPVKNTWYYIELALDKEIGGCVLFINGKEDSSYIMSQVMKDAVSVDVTLGYQPPTDYWPGAVGEDNSTKLYDDFYARGDSRLGPVVITTRFPTNDQNVQWFKAGSQPSHAATVGDLPPDPLNQYVASATIGQEDRFTSTKSLANANAIVATALVVLARKSASLNAHLGVFMGQAGGAAVRQATLTVDTNWHSQYTCYDIIGGDTVANIQASQFGVTVLN